MKHLSALTLALFVAVTPLLTTQARAASELPALASTQLSLSPEQKTDVFLLAAENTQRETFQIAQATPRAATAARDSKNPWIAAALNFFTMGGGYLYNGQKPVPVSLGLIAGAVGLTYVENVGLGPQHPMFAPMFASVFVANTALAFDAFQEAERINRGE